MQNDGGQGYLGVKRNREMNLLRGYCPRARGKGRMNGLSSL